MLFVYITAIVMAIGVWFGSLVLLTVSELHEPKYMLFMFILVCVVIGTTWAIQAMSKAAYEELDYWDFFQ